MCHARVQPYLWWRPVRAEKATQSVRLRWAPHGSITHRGNVMLQQRQKKRNLLMTPSEKDTTKVPETTAVKTTAKSEEKNWWHRQKYCSSVGCCSYYVFLNCYCLLYLQNVQITEEVKPCSKGRIQSRLRRLLKHLPAQRDLRQESLLCLHGGDRGVLRWTKSLKKGLKKGLKKENHSKKD